MVSNLIFDLGLNKGEDSEFYLRKGFKVVAVDASRQLCAFAEARLKKYVDAGELNILNYAIADHDAEKITFYENTQNSVWGTIDEDWRRNKKPGADSTAVEVSSLRLDTLIRQFGLPYYLKIDIEGMDFLAIRQLLNLKERPKYLSIESEKISWKKLVQECSFLKQLGYTKFKIVNQKKITTQRCPNPPLEGKFVSHKFEEGSSGLFGEELPGTWMSFDECIKAYRKIFQQYQLFGDYGLFNKRYLKFAMRKIGIKYPDIGWYDTHATW